MMMASALSALRSLRSRVHRVPPSFSPNPNPNAYDLLDMVRAVVHCILSDIALAADVEIDSHTKTPISTSVYVAITMRK